MSQELKIASLNNMGNITFSKEIVEKAVYNISQYLCPLTISSVKLYVIPEFDQKAFLIRIKMDNKQSYTIKKISEYKKQVKEEISKSLNLSGFNLVLTFY